MREFQMKKIGLQSLWGITENVPEKKNRKFTIRDIASLEGGF